MYQEHLWWLRSNGMAVLSVGLLNYGQKTALIKPNSPWPSTQKPRVHWFPTALRSTPELASPGVKISFLFKGFLLLFPIRHLVDAKKFDANFPSALAASICFLDAKIWKLASEDPFLASRWGSGINFYSILTPVTSLASTTNLDATIKSHFYFPC